MSTGELNGALPRGSLPDGRPPHDPKQRFSNRVENYVRFRPGYPNAILRPLVEACGLAPGALVADVGCGPGNLARVFLDFGCVVTGIEPNSEMFAAGVRQLAGYSRFTGRPGSAEATGLADNSVDFIIAGQAFHWFDLPKARPEFTRILRPGGWLVLVWNERRVAARPFQREYEQLMREFGLEYSTVKGGRSAAAAIQDFYARWQVRLAIFQSAQRLDYPALEGRALSSSYVPEPGHPHHKPFLTGLREIFERNQQDGQVTIDYETRLYYGQL